MHLGIKPLIQATKSSKMQIEANSDDFKIPLKASFSTGKAADTNANLVELYVMTHIKRKVLIYRIILEQSNQI